ncbi:MAG: mannose-1-phosphate guanylyltransferase [Stygiobacter sp. RIFOXYC12_FULL_38_8]|nr:MAG: mannose-1-phosphate guanylyltransferase [Stygiobacter sp. RIFOXYA12_FULL_38_9]OGV06075.1 MAG: mannose-1-phosphate guanylyltransferase [Stygiobacter sp. RIFOXYB2_FULL_37_11]OGV10200.1 MAG: mannose-1-phosphate guanylyltransferase [Stygiobacter sp. RIFOXYA2_FULL_38_8]OGV16861.1 MAG: mannose-1-phosphate guanylyltransferase [Stygiobacter sp. RIFOXYC2_FULL_38_25]OGV28508.1 MAG: mannose-1-phosphate guanylyltransferase [Stygiobacter sp. RIFOXYC12_FULL_38_8]OGV82788.1 MAG: mannose-1-phosphate g
MELYAVIMAGGVGSRFWPRSKECKPKQLIRIFGDNTMIQDTVKRMEGLVEPKNIFVITNKVQKPRVIEQLPQLPQENIVDEPFGKNTAACIGLASVLIKAKNNEAVVLTLPSDHLIKDEDEFRKCLKNAAEFAYESKGLVTIGITPNRPETGYGYIQFDEKEISSNIYKVLTFAEKPNLATARRFIESGDFLWNAGIFIWRVDTILEEIKNFLPDLHEGLLEIESAIGTTDFEKQLVNVYGQLKSISIDYGVMEKAHNVYLTKADFYWNDVGSWEAVYEVAEKDEEGNALVGDVYTEKTFGSYVFSPKKFVATIGVENLIIIDTHEALLVCNRDNAQEVRQIVEYLKMNKRSELI